MLSFDVVSRYLDGSSYSSLLFVLQAYNRQYPIRNLISCFEMEPRRYLPHSVFDSNRTFIGLVNQIESSSDK
jgi:hypothetical protein